MDYQVWNWHDFWQHLMKIGIAYAISLPLGIEREHEAQFAGVRTFPIVAVASCGYVLVAESLTDIGGVSRLLQGLITGIGFVGGGAILKDGLTVHGTAAAASIWNTGAIGAAVALGRYEIAVVLAVVNIISLRYSQRLKNRLVRPRDANREIVK
jgi:putative Mg2+ transporter-C (MgtC) family protein